MWTFSNSTWKGQLKNVQDEISRPLGSREIQKTKVETVLWDTLYYLNGSQLKGQHSSQGEEGKYFDKILEQVRSLPSFEGNQTHFFFNRPQITLDYEIPK